MTFWQSKKVFITGHTGFKGAWLCLWLNALGADITGYALPSPTQPNLYALGNIDKLMTSIIGDTRNLEHLTKSMCAAYPEIVIHLAAQPLVRASYNNPAETYAINVMGTVNLFEAVRKCSTVRAVINVTTDKCYENKEWLWGYRENDGLGGYDPYSNSKACSELVTASYRNVFFNPNEHHKHGVAIASARAGNVIGGGDWAEDRLIPDCLNALGRNEKIIIRNPDALRPWQHVLEPLSGYLLLAQKLYEDGANFSEGWNFGPDDHDARPVEQVVKILCKLWGSDAAFEVNRGLQPHEAHFLKLDCSKAKSRLNWHPRWILEQSLEKVVEWTQAYRQKADIREICLRQIQEYAKTSAVGAY